MNILTHLNTANYKQYNTRIENSMETLMCWCQWHLFLLPPQLLLLAGRVVVWAGALELCWTSKWSLVKLCTLSGKVCKNKVHNSALYYTGLIYANICNSLMKNVLFCKLLRIKEHSKLETKCKCRRHTYYLSPFKPRIWGDIHLHLHRQCRKTGHVYPFVMGRSGGLESSSVAPLLVQLLLALPTDCPLGDTVGVCMPMSLSWTACGKELTSLTWHWTLNRMCNCSEERTVCEGRMVKRCFMPLDFLPLPAVVCHPPPPYKCKVESVNAKSGHISIKTN